MAYILGCLVCSAAGGFGDKPALSCCRPSINLTTRDNQDDKFLMGRYSGLLTRI